MQMIDLSLPIKCCQICGESRGPNGHPQHRSKTGQVFLGGDFLPGKPRGQSKARSTGCADERDTSYGRGQVQTTDLRASMPYSEPTKVWYKRKRSYKEFIKRLKGKVANTSNIIRGAKTIGIRNPKQLTR